MAKWKKRSNRTPITEEELGYARTHLAEVARRNGVSLDEVRSSITETIRTEMMNPDPAIRREWAESPFGGREPTPEEFVAWMTRQAVEKAVRDNMGIY